MEKNIIQKTAHPPLFAGDPLISERKKEHIAVCLQEDVETPSDLNHYQLQVKTLPDLNFSSVNTETRVFNRTFGAPFMVTGMTGGVEKGAEINRKLAAFAAHFNLPMGLGSQRLALEQPEFAYLFQVKDRHPDLFLIGNLGLGQILAAKDPVDLLKRARDMVDANMMAVHCNVLQELIQPEGDRAFKGLWQVLERLFKQEDVPILMKEVGMGFDQQTLQRLGNIGVKHLDVGGKGGTSWSKIEGMRSKDTVAQRCGAWFAACGQTTTQSLTHAARLKHQGIIDTLIATGGIRTPIDIFICCALGASTCGMGLPLLQEAERGEEALHLFGESIMHGLKVAMFLTDCPSMSDISVDLIHKKNSEKTF